MNVLLNAFFILLSLGQIGRIELFSSVAILSYEVVMSLVVALFLCTKWREFRVYRKNNHIKALGLFIGILSISFVVSLPAHSLVENAIAIAYLARLILYGLFFITLSSLRKTVLERGLQVFIFATVSFSLIQYLFIPNLQFLEPRGWDPHVGRAVGMFLDPTAAGIIFSLLFFYIILRHPESADRRRRISTWTLALISLFFLILLTYSRITYIGFVSGLVYLLVKSYRAKVVLTLIAFFLICIPFLPRIPGESTNLKRTFSINSRIADMQQGITVWQKHPLLGIGYNHIPSIKGGDTARNHSDSAFSSSFVTMLATSGVVGLGAFVYLLWSIYRKGSLVTQSATIIIALTSLMENVFLLNVVLAVYLILIALEDNR